MADNQATVENLLAWRVNESSIQAAVQANTRVATSFASVEAAAAALGLSADQVAGLNAQLGITAAETQAVSQVNVPFDKLTVSAKASADAIRQANTEASKLQSTASRVQLGGRSVGTGFNTLRSAGSAISLLGGGQGVSQVASFVGLTTTLGAAGAAAGIATIAIRALTDGEEQLAKKAQESADLINQIYAGAADATTASIQQQIEETTRQRDSLVQGQNTLKSLQPEADAHFGFVNLFGDSVRLSDLLQANQEDIDKANVALAGFNIQLGTDAIKANVAAAAAEKFAQQLADATEKTTRAQLGEVDRLVAIQQKTKEQRDEEVTSIGEEITVRENYLATHALTKESFDALTAELELLRQRSDELTTSYITWADVQAQIAAQEQSVTTQGDNYLAALTQEGEIRDRITQTIQDMADLDQDTQQRRMENQQDYQQRIGDIELEAGQRREEITQDAADRILRIEQRAAFEQLGAIANRDALAFDQAKQKAAEQAADQQLAERRQLERLDRNLDRRELIEGRSFDHQQRQLEDATSRQVRTFQHAYQQEQVDLTNALYNQQQIALYGSGGRIAIETQTQQTPNNIMVTWAANTANTVRSILNNMLGGLGQGGAGSSHAYQIGYQAARDYVYNLNAGGRMMPG